MFVHQLTHDGKVDLDVLAGLLAHMFAQRAVVGRDAGRERLTRTVVMLLGSSRQAAEQVIAALIFRSQLVFYTDCAGREQWRFGAPPARC